MNLYNSITDLQPLTVMFLADKEWHCFASVLRNVGYKIMPERAVRFYQGQGSGANAAAKNGGDPRPIDERVRAGRRRGVYLVLTAMLRRKMIECKDQLRKPDDREYRLLSEVPPLRKGSKSEVKRGQVPSKGKKIVRLVDNLEKEFFASFPSSKDRGDLKFHCRNLKRIALLQAVPPMTDNIQSTEE